MSEIPAEVYENITPPQLAKWLHGLDQQFSQQWSAIHTKLDEVLRRQDIATASLGKNEAEIASVTDRADKADRLDFPPAFQGVLDRFDVMEEQVQTLINLKFKAIGFLLGASTLGGTVGAAIIKFVLG